MAEKRRQLRNVKREEQIYADQIDELLREMKDLGTSESSVAEKLQIAKSTLTSYKKGNAVPDLITALRMAKLFGVSIDYLAGLTKSRTPDLNDRAASERYGLSGEALELLKEYQLKCDTDGVYEEALVGLNLLFSTSAPHLFLALIDRYLTNLFEDNNYVEISDNLDLDIHNSFGKVKLGRQDLEKLLILDKMTAYLVEERDAEENATSQNVLSSKKTLEDIMRNVNIKYGDISSDATNKEDTDGKTDKERKK